MKKILPIGLLVGLVSLLLVSCTIERPQIKVESLSFEFGDVVNGVIASQDLQIENVGTAPLEISNIATSCGCTTASIEPSILLPGESGILHIEFDSGAHGPDATGELLRQIFIFSNDPDLPEVMVEFTVNVVK